MFVETPAATTRPRRGRCAARELEDRRRTFHPYGVRSVVVEYYKHSTTTWLDPDQMCPPTRRSPLAHFTLRGEAGRRRMLQTFNHLIVPNPVGIQCL